MTSDSSRINRAVQVLGEIYEQRVSPDAVFLWLPSFGFPCREKDLPKELVRMISENGLSIRWCEKDVELHDTYFLTLQDYPDALVVMVEDDINCHEQITEKLYHSYLLHPQDVSAAMIVCTPVTSALADKQRELDAVKNGWSFKIGKVITWLPRKLCGGYRCWREHGLTYTLKRCWEKLKNV